MNNSKLKESAEEKVRSYGDMVRDLGMRFLQDRKRFKSAINRVSEMLEGREFNQFQALSRNEDLDDVGDFEDQYEEICGAKDKEEKRELVRLVLRHM
jgi:hypothetical protein